MGGEDPGLLDPFFARRHDRVRGVAGARPRRLAGRARRAPRAARARGRGQRGSRSRSRDRRHRHVHVRHLRRGAGCPAAARSSGATIPAERAPAPRRDAAAAARAGARAAPGSAGTTSSGSASAPARAASPACGSGSPPPARSRRATTCRSSASPASRRSRAGRRARPSGTARAGRDRRPPRRGLRRRLTAASRCRADRDHPRRAGRAAARREWGRSPMLAVGDGAVRFRAELERAGVAVPADGSRAHRVSALMVCRLGGRGSPSTATPCSRITAASRTPAPPPAVDRPPSRRHRGPPPHVRRPPEVVAIERRAFTSAWSLAMFVLELSKPSRDLPGGRGRRRAGRLPDLLALRHGLAHHERGRRPDLRRRGIATALLSRVLERVATRRAADARGAALQRGAITLYESFGFRSPGVRRRYYQDNGEDAIVMWRTPATLRGTLDDVPGT